MSEAPAFTAEVLDAFRRAICQRIQYWEATADLESLLGREVAEGAFELAGGCHAAEDAHRLGDELLVATLSQCLGASFLSPDL